MRRATDPRQVTSSRRDLLLKLPHLLRNPPLELAEYIVAALCDEMAAMASRGTTAAIHVRKPIAKKKGWHAKCQPLKNEPNLAVYGLFTRRLPK